MKCPYCNQEHPDDFKFCPQTGKFIEMASASNDSSCKDSKHIPHLDTRFWPGFIKPMNDGRYQTKNVVDTTNTMEDVGSDMLHVSKYGKFAFWVDDAYTTKNGTVVCGLVYGAEIKIRDKVFVGLPEGGFLIEEIIGLEINRRPVKTVSPGVKCGILLRNKNQRDITHGSYICKIEDLYMDNGDDFDVSVHGCLFNLVWVQPGSFIMGSDTKADEYANEDECPEHQVTISHGYFMMEHPVTYSLWHAVMRQWLMDDDLDVDDIYEHPVTGVSWNDCQVFIEELNRITGLNFRLPTEAEWEFAALGGTESRNCIYSGSDDIEEVAWYAENSGGASVLTHPVMNKAPNELGLYDMCGNVYEWCQDYYTSYRKHDVIDPQGPKEGEEKVCRGGAYFENAIDCRIKCRAYEDMDLAHDYVGFRLVLQP